MSVTARVEAPLRVLHLSRWLLSAGGGIRTFLAQVAASVDARAVRMQAAALEPGTPPSYIPEVRYMGRQGDSRLVAMMRFWCWLRQELVGSVDVVHIHGVFHPLLVVGALECLRREIPYVVSAHGALEPWALLQKSLAKRVFLGLGGRTLLRRSAAVLATTPGNAERLRLMDRRLPVRVITPGVSVEPEPSVDFLGEGNERPLRVLFLGQLQPVKGLEVLHAALALMLRDGIDAHLDVVGSGERAWVEALKARIASLGLGKRVALHGYLDGPEKTRYLRAAHVLAVPSYGENFSFAAAEALAIGLPVVVTASVGLAPLVQQFDCGTVVPPGDARALAEALAEYRDPALRRARALRAHACAAQALSLRSMGLALQALYSDVAGTGAADSSSC